VCVTSHGLLKTNTNNIKKGKIKTFIIVLMCSQSPLCLSPRTLEHLGIGAPNLVAPHLDLS
jgi:hypothetical protein